MDSMFAAEFSMQQSTKKKSKNAIIQEPLNPPMKVAADVYNYIFLKENECKGRPVKGAIL